MNAPVIPKIAEIDLNAIESFEGRVVLTIGEQRKLNQSARRVNRLSKGALGRLVASAEFEKLKSGQSIDLAYPAAMAATAVQVIKLERNASVEQARKAGATIAVAKSTAPLLVIVGNLKHAAELALGLSLRVYKFDDHKSDEVKPEQDITLMVSNQKSISARAADNAALAQGVFFTRDLTNEPSNILTTVEFAERLKALSKLGVKVQVLDEPALKKLGMNTLLAVGEGSESPSKVVVMQWEGGGKERPFALVGKGVVFDTGGISIKPSAGMEEMTMDMGGAGVVSGVMKTLALRKAKANVVGIVGIVENMPDGRAMRPGDVVTSMKGDTVEIINTDAEGRLVLADILWYAQEKFKPAGMINLATLTGAVIVGLGYENAGVFSNDDALCNWFLKAAVAECEGAWRLPLGESYDKMLKSNYADMRNSCGRDAGSITAAQFLKRFVKDETPWIHLDIAGVAMPPKATALAPKGASGWGVLALNRLIANKFEN